jgi:hypothetical protein
MSLIQSDSEVMQPRGIIDAPTLMETANQSCMGQDNEDMSHETCLECSHMIRMQNNVYLQTHTIPEKIPCCTHK